MGMCLKCAHLFYCVCYADSDTAKLTARRAKEICRAMGGFKEDKRQEKNNG